MTKEYITAYLRQGEGGWFTYDIHDTVVKITCNDETIYIGPDGNFHVSVMNELEFNKKYSIEAHEIRP